MEHPTLETHAFRQVHFKGTIHALLDHHRNRQRLAGNHRCNLQRFVQQLIARHNPRNDAATLGFYRIDQQAFDDGLGFFKRDRFDEARAAFARADPAGRDSLTQFYLAYSYYRQGWGRFYNDDRLFASGVEAVKRAIAEVRGR